MNCNTNRYFDESVNIRGLKSILTPVIKKNLDKSIEEVYKEILNKLSSLEDFKFGKEFSGTRYLNSVSSLQDSILTFLEPMVTKLRSSKDYVELKRLFLSNFLADSGINSDSVKEDTDPEGAYMENNPDMPNENQRLKESLDDITDTFYGTLSKANEYRKRLFGLDLVKSAIIDTNERIIVRTTLHLNKALGSLQNRYFENIVKWLQSIDPNYSLETSLFDSKLRVNNNYKLVLNKFYNELTKLKKNDTNYENKIKEGWKRRLIGQADLLYDALNSYVNLVYFDRMLLDTIGKVIQLSDDVYLDDIYSINVEKYKFSKGDEHLRKGFQNSENRDALKDIAKFSKLVISTIPIYSFDEGKFLNRYCNVGIVANAITSLFTKVHLLGDNYLTLLDAIVNFHSNPYYYSGIIFKELSNTNNNILYNLLLSGINRFDMHVLTSMFKYIYDTNNKNSIKSIESDDMRNQFTIDGYSIVDAINGVIDRTMDATYLLQVYSSTNNMVETSVKSKFNTRRESYNLMNKINVLNLSRSKEERAKIARAYPLVKEDLTLKAPVWDSSCKTFSVTINGKVITATTKSSLGLLDSQIIDIKFGDESVAKLFDPNDSTINLNDTNSINKILKGKDLSDDELSFRDILKFIDTFLFTDFLSEDGLNKLFLYKLIKESSTNYLSDILGSAFRAAVVNSLYHLFNEALDKKKYNSLREFNKFLIDTYTPFGTIDFKDYSETSLFFTNKLGVALLTSVNINEDWIDNLTNVENILTAEVSASTTYDINNNKIANNRTSFLGGNLKYYLSKYRKGNETDAVSPLLFTHNSNLIAKAVFNTDAQSRTGIKKNVRDMKASELFYTSIINNFYGSYLLADYDLKKYGENNELTRTILTQPTTFSDKVSIVTYAIRANTKLKFPGKSYDGKTIWLLTPSQTVDLFYDTVGLAYINLYNNVLADLLNVLDMPNATVEQIDAALNTISLLDLLKRALEKHIDLQLDTHYRTFGDYCKFNELLYHYGTYLYTDKDNLKKRFELEKVNFLNDLLASGVCFYTYYYDDSNDIINRREGKKSSNSVSRILDLIDKIFPNETNRRSFTDKWVKGNKLILAKVNGQDIVRGSEIPLDSKVLLNPIFEKYFYTDALLSNNLRFSLTGSEVAHPDKAKINYTKELHNIGITKDTNPEYFLKKVDKKGNISYIVIDNFKNLVWLRQEILKHPEIPALEQLYDKAILNVEAIAQGTLLKRNVIIPATLLYEQQMTLNGIPPKMKVAVIKDTKAKVFNFRGNNDKVDAHDGSAYINPFVSILENKALLDLEVGVDKKPIWHSFNARLMSATLLKFATFTMTNERMRNLNSDISLYELFKQMTNMLWAELNEDGSIRLWNTRNGVEFNLITSKGLRKNQYDNISDTKDSSVFSENILSGKKLFYEEDGNHYQILNFSRDENGYFTIEAEVSSLGTRYNDNNDIKVYHRFNANGDHFRYRNSENVPKITAQLHDINSNFELFNVLGGIYSEELLENLSGVNILTYTDASSYAVVNFMNNVSIRVGNDSSDLSLRTYYLPLKDMMIAYAANLSAVKNGTSNINESVAWKGKTKLMFMELDTDGLGIQMDADHEIDEAEMTEFSLVISALEAGGRLHHMSKLVYRTLGQLAMKASELEIDAATKYIKAKNSGLSTEAIKSELYDILGRIIINNYKLKDDRVDLTAPIIAEIKKKFNLSNDHSLDKFKIPFSDSNLYSNVISTFVSAINSKSIKRKYPGSGCVMVPGYNIILTYKYDGKIKMFDDVLKEARLFLKNSKRQGNAFFRDFNPEIETISSYNSNLVTAYLRSKQLELYKTATSSVDLFMPTDIVDILADGQYLTTINLGDIEAYYNFKGFTAQDIDGNNREIIRRGFIGNKSGIDISSVKELTFAINVTDPRDLAPARIRWKYQENGKERIINIFDTKPVRESFLLRNNSSFNAKVNRRLILNLFNLLDEGFYNGLQIYDLENEAAELVISNMYASKFNTRGKSLADIIEEGPKGFTSSKLKPINSEHYDLVFTTGNGRHTYISFTKPTTVSDLFNIREEKWKYTKTIGTDVYAITKDGQKLYKIGKNISRNDLDYVNDLYVNKETNEVVDSTNLRISNSKVVEYKEFLSNYKVVEKVSIGKHNKHIAYNLLVFNLANIKDGLKTNNSRDEDNLVAKILSDIFAQQGANGIRLNYSIESNIAKRLAYILPNIKVNGVLLKFLLKNVLNYLSNIDDKSKKHTIDKKTYDADLLKYYNSLSKEIYASFLKSLTFTASRIPAQTLLSFMQMKAVALTLSSKNIVYVSHWQTWLQGSDYRPKNLT